MLPQEAFSLAAASCFKHFEEALGIKFELRHLIEEKYGKRAYALADHPTGRLEATAVLFNSEHPEAGTCAVEFYILGQTPYPKFKYSFSKDKLSFGELAAYRPTLEQGKVIHILMRRT